MRSVDTGGDEAKDLLRSFLPAEHIPSGDLDSNGLGDERCSTWRCSLGCLDHQQGIRRPRSSCPASPQHCV